MVGGEREKKATAHLFWTGDVTGISQDKAAELVEVFNSPLLLLWGLQETCLCLRE